MSTGVLVASRYDGQGCRGPAGAAARSPHSLTPRHHQRGPDTPCHSSGRCTEVSIRRGRRPGAGGVVKVGGTGPSGPHGEEGLGVETHHVGAERRARSVNSSRSPPRTSRRTPRQPPSSNTAGRSHRDDRRAPRSHRGSRAAAMPSRTGATRSRSDRVGWRAIAAAASESSSVMSAASPSRPVPDPPSLFTVPPTGQQGSTGSGTHVSSRAGPAAAAQPGAGNRRGSPASPRANEWW